MYNKSEIPGNGLKNFQNVFKMLTMLVSKFSNFSFRSKVAQNHL